MHSKISWLTNEDLKDKGLEGWTVEDWEHNGNEGKCLCPPGTSPKELGYPDQTDFVLQDLLPQNILQEIEDQKTVWDEEYTCLRCDEPLTPSYVETSTWGRHCPKCTLPEHPVFEALDRLMKETE